MLVISHILSLILSFLANSLFAKAVKQDNTRAKYSWVSFAVYFLIIVLVAMFTHYWPMMVVGLLIWLITANIFFNLLLGNKWSDLGSLSQGAQEKLEDKVFKHNFALEKVIYVSALIVFDLILYEFGTRL